MIVHIVMNDSIEINVTERMKERMNEWMNETHSWGEVVWVNVHVHV